MANKGLSKKKGVCFNPSRRRQSAGNTTLKLKQQKHKNKRWHHETTDTKGFSGFEISLSSSQFFSVPSAVIIQNFSQGRPSQIGGSWLEFVHSHVWTGLGFWSRRRTWEETEEENNKVFFLTIWLLEAHFCLSIINRHNQKPACLLINRSENV